MVSERGNDSKGADKVPTIKDLREAPFRDAEFIRFLKERGDYADFKRELYDDKNFSYQHDTILNTSYRHMFFVKRDYIFHGVKAERLTNRRWVNAMSSWRKLIGI